MNELKFDHPVPPAPPAAKLHRLQFTGDANEYFRIWIVNLFLSIITLGIYAAWAKVRTRQYLYANTLLDGHAFEYLGNPTAILRGNVIVALAAACYFAARQTESGWLIFLSLLFAAAYPFLVYKSLRFTASNSAYRNVRFKFWGDLSGAYKNYLWWMLLVPLTFGLIYPLVFFKQRKYMFDHLSLGQAHADFPGEAAAFYKPFLIVYAISAVAYGLGIAIMTAIFAAALIGGRDNSGASVVLIGLGALLYVGALVMGVAMQQYIYAETMNYTLNKTVIEGGQIRFRMKLNHWSLFRIQLVNILAIAVSLGLLTPWAKIRSLKYILSRVGVLAIPGALDQIAAAPSQEENALGDAAVDFLDLEIGL